MSDVLAAIISDKRKHVARQKEDKPETLLLQNLAFVPETRGFARALKEKLAKGKIALIAEVKKASPSKGTIREDFDPIEIALSYKKGGATCLSVLTDEKYFAGRDEYLTTIKKTVSLPILRKDFIIDPYQVVESRILGADCILLIMAAVDDKMAAEIEAKAMELKLDVLVEVHNKHELERALRLKSRLIGINNRNLKTLEVNLNTTTELKRLIPEGYITVCESGIYTNADVKKISKSGVGCFLVGESLMKQEDITAATKKLLGN